MVRADCWPPNRFTVQGNAETNAGDIARPVQIINGNRTRITNKYVSRWSKLYDQASVSLGRSKRRCLASVLENSYRVKPALPGSRFLRKCPLASPKIA